MCIWCWPEVARGRDQEPGAQPECYFSNTSTPSADREPSGHAGGSNSIMGKTREKHLWPIRWDLLIHLMMIQTINHMWHSPGVMFVICSVRQSVTLLSFSADAQAQLAVSIEKERSATEELLAIRAQNASLESQTSLLRQEKGRLQGQLDAERMRRETLEDDFSRWEEGLGHR